MFDITQFAPADTGFMHLKSPRDEEPIFVGAAANPLPVGITFHAPGSEAYEAANKRRTNRSLGRSKKKIDLTADLLRSDNVTFLTDITVSFDNLAYPPAADLAGADLHRALYADPKYGWVVEQAQSHLGDWGNFSTKPPAS
ncbi:hypothetical protein PQ455_07430 [Sphingomonas naphthae]|uniref:Uncharacterized protein n=1 Tax=Sphingomonas naphthae TaxID=1813468 RepID=A0ABY7TP74_9SPHN|nr:hypothetical protein [Sphingomonas naphthae]WCT75037.1 hypothetical protein PQ455_07430 [Sphingomonas naphthae]